MASSVKLPAHNIDLFMELQVTELEKDIIKEILNIGLARAADSFALIAKDKVLMKVPDVELIGANELFKLITGYEDTHEIIQSDIKGDLNGTTLMLFSTDHVEMLSAVCLNLKEPFKKPLSPMQESLLLEISNIITGAFVTQLANILKADIYGSPPLYPLKGINHSLNHIFEVNPLFQPMVFTVLTHFTDHEGMVELPLFLFFDTLTFNKILEIIRSYKFYEER
ncbi:chemotaxis protein CheC [Adhaeribacter pallidiroseus]|uniref:CheY-P phosphatase CheC n=1 Tax=Adhaeribacter pallidiroseus TaxID=2072847 RepID=A0A369QDZ0_9BACT|nr:chemotaxis protein CheC [Adhaeribacter pallidiroseus]RDC62632.1 CheY-P phosphatase CheC [Adhaeribacter pallidiroseus]